jgi:hypothetical protein
MEEITNEKGCEESSGNLFLYCGFVVEVFAECGEDKDVYETHEGTNVGELNDCDDCRWW